MRPSVAMNQCSVRVCQGPWCSRASAAAGKGSHQLVTCRRGVLCLEAAQQTGVRVTDSAPLGAAAGAAGARVPPPAAPRWRSRPRRRRCPARSAARAASPAATARPLCVPRPSRAATTQPRTIPSVKPCCSSNGTVRHTHSNAEPVTVHRQHPASRSFTRFLVANAACMLMTPT